MRIVQQELQEIGIKTTWEDGSITLEPYSIDENGESYVDLDPNKEIFGENYGHKISYFN